MKEDPEFEDILHFIMYSSTASATGVLQSQKKNQTHMPHNIQNNTDLYMQMFVCTK